MTRFALNVERVKPRPQAEELCLTDQVMGELKDRLPPDAGYKLSTDRASLLSPRGICPWCEILLALIRCEFKARYDYLGSWQISARGALPVIMIIVAALAVWGRWQ
jgi:hypothetical protein